LTRNGGDMHFDVVASMLTHSHMDKAELRQKVYGPAKFEAIRRQAKGYTKISRQKQGQE